MESSVVFPEIETDQLVLTELQLNDDEAIFELFSNKLAIEYDDLEAFTTIERFCRIGESPAPIR